MTALDWDAFELLTFPPSKTVRGFCHRCHRLSHYETRLVKCRLWFSKHKCTVKLSGKQVLHNVHDDRRCVGSACTIHNPSDHHMVDWPQLFRDDRRLMERVCPHGIGHPDPDDPAVNTVHGCDGCCAPPPLQEGP